VLTSELETVEVMLGDAKTAFLGSKTRPSTRAVFQKTAASVHEQDVLEYEFFIRVVLPNGTVKTTQPHRLDDLNRAALPYIERHSERPVKIMDVGVSSGVSTQEWYDQLSASNISCDITATDLTIYASLVSFAPHLSALIDGNRNILHLDVWDRGMPPSATGLRGFCAATIRMLFHGAMMVDGHLPPLQGRIREAAKGRLLRCEPLTLLSRKLTQNESLRVVEEDLIAPERPDFKAAFHVVRAANVLNRIYFSDQTLVQIIKKLNQRLKPNCILIVCRTDKAGVNHATIFESVANATLRIIFRLGDGSEIEQLVSGMCL
jgi:chemotaxis methyl-accepting protein methylase